MARKAMALYAIGLMLALVAPVCAQNVDGVDIRTLDVSAGVMISSEIIRAEIGAPTAGPNVAPEQGAGDTSPAYPTKPPPAPAALESPKTGIMEAGQLIVTVSAARKYRNGPAVNYGYRTGQLIPLTVVISADPHVLIDLKSLENEALNKDGSKFEMVAPMVVAYEERNGKRITIIQLVVRSWDMELVVPFNCQFHYAIGYLPNGKTPDWKLATTPDFPISMSRTATEASQELLSGDTDVKRTAQVWWSKPLEIGGAIIMLLVPLWMIYRYWQIWRNATDASRAKRAWSIIDKAYAEREGAGHEEFSLQQLKLISAALRDYLGVESIPTAAAQERLENTFRAHKHGDHLKTLSLSALSKLDRAVYSQSRLTSEETNALIDEISRIVPRE